jgi:hypothetical protein
MARSNIFIMLVGMKGSQSKKKRKFTAKLKILERYNKLVKEKKKRKKALCRKNSALSRKFLRIMN